MSTWADLLQKAVLLTAHVDSLKADMKRLNDLVMAMNDRLVRLETSGDLIAEKAKNAALSGTQAMNAEILRELYSLKARMDIGGVNPTSLEPARQSEKRLDSITRSDP